MPPRRARTQEKPLALGFFGVGEITDKDLKSQLDDLVGERETTIYLGIAPETTVDTFSDVIDWAKEAKVPVTVFAIEEGLRRNEKAWVKAADHVEPGGDVVAQVVDKLADSKNVDGRLILFWDEDEAAKDEPDDGRAFDALEAGSELNVPAYNICKALDLIDLDDDEGDQSAAAKEEPAPEPEPEKPAPRSRSRRAAEPEEDKAPEEKPARRSRTRKPAEKSDEAQADAGREALDKLEANRKATPKGGQGSVGPRVKTGDVDFAQAVTYIADLVADRIIERLRQEADANE